MSENYQPTIGDSELFARKRGISMPQALRAGRIPPQALDMEQAVLGAIIVERSAMEKVEDILTPDMFYKEGHRLIFEACLQLKAKRDPIDLRTVKEQLSINGNLENVGGFHYLIELSGKVASAANIAAHARTIAKKAAKRAAIKIGDKMVTDGFDETIEPDDIFEEASIAISSVTIGDVSNMTHMPDTQIEAMKRLELNMQMRKQMLEQGKPMVTGIPSGLNELDAVTLGWQDGNLVVKAARPSMGKTKDACQIAIAAADSGATVAFFSLEMTKDEIQDNIAGAKAGVSPRDMGSGSITPHALQRLQTAWAKTTGIHIDDTAAVSLAYVRKNARIQRAKNPKGKFLIVIDYLQLMKAVGKRNFNREQEVAEISKGLKELAKELKCPVIAFSQLSRAVETRGGDKKPMLSDLRESGEIEQSADLVIFLYRASYYGLDVYEDGSSTKYTGEMLIAKHRGGPLRDIKLGWEPWCRGWVNKDTEIVPEPTEGAVPKFVGKDITISNTERINEDENSDGGGGDFFPF